MAVFNPQVQPINDPDWTRISHPISDIAADKSTALAIEGTAQALESATTIAEHTDKDIIKEKARAGVETLQRGTTLAYEDIRNAQLTGQQPSDQSQKTAGFTLAQAGYQEVPGTLQAGLDRAGDIATARAQGAPKANDTLYTGALNSLVKQLRNEFPGHKDFIDEQISKISGKNPANAYMDNLLQDINRNATAKDTFDQRLLSKAMENYGAPDVQLAIKAWHAGVPGARDKVEEYTARAERDKWQQTQHSQETTNVSKDLALDADLAKSQYQQRASASAFRNFNPVIDLPGLTSPALQQKLIDDQRAGLPSSITTTQWADLLSNAQRARDVAANELKDIANNGGYSKRIRDPAAETAIQNNELQYFDRQIEAIKNKDVGTMFDLKRRATLLQDNTNYQVISNPDFGDYLRKSQVLKEHLGDQWVSWINQNGLMKGYLGRFQNFFADSAMKAGVPDDIRRDGVAKSMTADILAAKQQAANTKVPPRLYDDLIDNVKMITQAEEMGKTDIAKEVVKYTFDPAHNGNLIKQFGRDFTDDNKVFHKGQFAYYDVLTQRGIVDSVHKLKDKASWDMMKDWQETSFKTLFGEEVKKLNGIQGDRSMPIKLTWDSDAGQIVLEFGKANTNVEANYINYAQKSIADLNKGLANLKYMKDKEGTDTSAYLMNTLMELGYSPNDRLHGDNLPQRVIESIAASHKSNRIEDAFKAAKGK